MAEEDLMREEDVLAEVESGETFLRREEDVVELPPNVQNLQIKLERIRGEISTLQTRFDSVREELDTRIAAFNWFNGLLQNALKEK